VIFKDLILFVKDLGLPIIERYNIFAKEFGKPIIVGGSGANQFELLPQENGDVKLNITERE